MSVFEKIMKSKRKFFLFPLILLLPFLLFFFVKYPGGLGDSSTESSLASIQFSKLTSELLAGYAEDSGLSLHFMLENPEHYGLTETGKFSCYETQNYEQSASEPQTILNRLSLINKSELTEKEQIFYDIIEWNLKKELELCNYLYYEDCFSLRSGVQNQLLTLFAEYRFDQKSDVDCYLSLLSGLPEYMSSFIEYENQRAEEGLLVQTENLADVSTQCADYARLFSTDSNFLVTTFHNRLTECGLFSDSECNTYEQKNLQILTEQVAPCYQELASYFSDLSEKEFSANESADFSGYYETYIQYITGTDEDIASLFQRGKTRLGQDLTSLYGLFAADKDLLSDLSSAEFPESDPYKILAWLENSMDGIFPKLDSMTYEIKEVDDALTPFTAPAFYLIPAMDNNSCHTIYINPAHFNFTDESGNPQSTGKLFSTLAHEGYPGHLYQNAWFLSTNPDVCRRLFYSTGYAEGWAVYTEQYSYKLAGLPDNIALALQYNASFSLGIYAMCDIGINYYEWGLEEATNFLAQYGLNSIDVEGIINTVREEPGSYLPYYFGLLELESLKKEMKQMMGDDYTELAFHEYYLNFGPAPFPVLEKWLEKKTAD